MPPVEQLVSNKAVEKITIAYSIFLCIIFLPAINAKQVLNN